VTSLVLSSNPVSATSYQLQADARFSDGSSKNVTASAAWQSSNASVAQVSSAGTLTVVGNGQVDVRATYENVTGSLTLTVTMPSTSRYLLTGFVSEAPPGSKLLEGVRIMITSGPDAGTFSYSDETGIFRFGSLQRGTLTLAIDHAGYQPWSRAIPFDADTNLPIVLYPDPPKDATGATATARCRDGSWSWAQTLETACTTQGGVAYEVCPGVLCQR
jgi:hypothetical protein